MFKKPLSRIKLAVNAGLEIEGVGARFENHLGTFDVRESGDEKGIITQDEITKDLLITLPDDSAARISLNEIGAAAIKSWGQYKAKRCMRGAKK